MDLWVALLTGTWELVGNAEPFYLWVKKNHRKTKSHQTRTHHSRSSNQQPRQYSPWRVQVHTYMQCTWLHQRGQTVEFFQTTTIISQLNHTWFCLNYSSCSVAPQRVIPFMHNKILWCFIYFHNQVIQCIIGEFLSSSNSNSAEHAKKFLFPKIFQTQETPTDHLKIYFHIDTFHKTIASLIVFKQWGYKYWSSKWNG